MKSEDICLLVGSIVLIGLAIAVALLMPLAQIWAFNTLFGTSIKYNLTNWFAVLVLSSFWLRIPPVNRKKSD